MARPSIILPMNDPITPQQIDNWFAFHPATRTTGPLHDDVREQFRNLAHWLARKLPSGPDRTLTIRKLQEAMWSANATIACDPERHDYTSIQKPDPDA